MRQSSSLSIILLVGLCCVFPVAEVFADPSGWDVVSYQLQSGADVVGGSGDVQIVGSSGDVQIDEQNGWIYLGRNHLEGGDVKFSVNVGPLVQEDIIEVWVDGYSSSTELDVGPTVFIGTGKNRYEQITRMTGDAWRPFVFRFVDDALYGDVTDPSNRNANWRIRYPSSKYEIRRIDKAPYTMLDGNSLPMRISMTGVDDFIIKRLEVVAYRAKEGSFPRGGGVHIVRVDPYRVREGNRVTVTLNTGEFADYVEFYLEDPAGREYKVATQSISPDNSVVAFYADEYYFPRNGQYQLKLVNLSNSDQRYADVEPLEYIGRTVVKPKAQPTPPILSPEIECGTALVDGSCLPPVPVMPGTSYGVPGPYISPVPVPYAELPYGPVPGPSPMIMPSPQSQIQAAGYTIQVGAFTSHSSAVALRDRLQQRGFDAYIAESSKGGKPLFRVRVGRFLDKSAASQEVQRLRGSGFSDTWITDLL